MAENSMYDPEPQPGEQRKATSWTSRAALAFGAGVPLGVVFATDPAAAVSNFAGPEMDTLVDSEGGYSHHVDSATVADTDVAAQSYEITADGFDITAEDPTDFVSIIFDTASIETPASGGAGPVEMTTGEALATSAAGVSLSASPVVQSPSPGPSLIEGSKGVAANDPKIPQVSKPAANAPVNLTKPSPPVSLAKPAANTARAASSTIFRHVVTKVPGVGAYATAGLGLYEVGGMLGERLNVALDPFRHATTEAESKTQTTIDPLRAPLPAGTILWNESLTQATTPGGAWSNTPGLNTPVDGNTDHTRPPGVDPTSPSEAHEPGAATVDTHFDALTKPALDTESHPATPAPAVTYNEIEFGVNPPEDDEIVEIRFGIQPDSAVTEWSVYELPDATPNEDAIGIQLDLEYKPQETILGQPPSITANSNGKGAGGNQGESTGTGEGTDTNPKNSDVDPSPVLNEEMTYLLFKSFTANTPLTASMGRVSVSSSDGLDPTEGDHADAHPLLSQPFLDGMYQIFAHQPAAEERSLTDAPGGTPTDAFVREEARHLFTAVESSAHRLLEAERAMSGSLQSSTGHRVETDVEHSAALQTFYNALNKLRAFSPTLTETSDLALPPRTHGLSGGELLTQLFRANERLGEAEDNLERFPAGPGLADPSLIQTKNEAMRESIALGILYERTWDELFASVPQNRQTEDDN